jgi:hypothetical protein
MTTTLWHIDAGEEGPSTPSKGREILRETADTICS